MLGTTWIYVLEFCTVESLARLLLVSKLFLQLVPPILRSPAIHPSFQHCAMRVALSNSLKRCFVCRKKTKVKFDLIPIHLCQRCRGSEDCLRTISPTQAKKIFSLQAADLVSIPTMTYWNRTWGQYCQLMLWSDVNQRFLLRKKTLEL